MRRTKPPGYKGSTRRGEDYWLFFSWRICQAWTWREEQAWPKAKDAAGRRGAVRCGGSAGIGWAEPLNLHVFPVRCLLSSAARYNHRRPLHTVIQSFRDQVLLETEAQPEEGHVRLRSVAERPLWMGINNYKQVYTQHFLPRNPHAHQNSYFVNS